MRKIKINFADTGGRGVLERFVLEVVEKQWDVEISNEPDYLFCGDFMTYEFLQYDCIKIYISGENEYPNFNLYDYAIGVNQFVFDDRYIRWPFYLWRDGTRKGFSMACRKHMQTKRKEQRKFCNFIVSNGNNADPYREEAFRQINLYKKVDSGGQYLNNIGYCVADKLQFMQGYKFTLACENSSQKGYITEKIVEAWAANTVPIYWGAPDIAEEFNENAFINCMAYRNIYEVIEKIKEIDCDDTKYLEILNEPIISMQSNAMKFMDDARLLEFFSNIFDKAKEEAFKIKRVARNMCIDCEIKRLVKNDEYYSLQVIWNENKKKGKKIINCPDIKNVGEIAVYGLGVLGQKLVDELKNDNKKIRMIIDQNDNRNMYEGVPIYTLKTVNGGQNKIDLIILTVKDDSQHIEKDIQKVFPKTKVIHIKQIICF